MRDNTPAIINIELIWLIPSSSKISLIGRHESVETIIYSPIVNDPDAYFINIVMTKEAKNTESNTVIVESLKSHDTKAEIITHIAGYITSRVGIKFLLVNNDKPNTIEHDKHVEKCLD